MTAAPPLRFLGLVLGGWVCVRAALLTPEWLEDEAVRAKPPLRVAMRPAVPSVRIRPAGGARAPSAGALPIELLTMHPPPAERRNIPSIATLPTVIAAALPQEVPALASLRFRAPPPAPAGPLPSFLSEPRVGRWSGSAWAFVRPGGAAALAASGALGGSQAGARLRYRLNGDAARPLSIQARVYAPTERPRAAEAALGVEWQPLAGVPIRLLAERRQGLTPAGRSAFSLSAYGGVSGKPVGPATLEAYGQAGVVGAKARDWFVEGSASLGLPLTEGARLGAAAWAGAQPGVWRVDAGPQLSVRLPGAARGVRLIADWRLRIAGDATPGSGPALTLATDF